MTATTQRGWPVQSTTDRLTRFPWITGHVLSGDVFTVLDYLCRRFHAEVEPIVKAHSWGWSHRPVRGTTSVWSEHAAAVAVDLNAPAHPLGAVGTFRTAQVTKIHQILADLDGLVSWGGDWSGRKDEMHFELRHDLPKLRLVAARLKGEKTPPTTPATPSPAPIGVRDTASITEWLKSRGRDYSFAARAKLAASYGIQNYRGTAAQNLSLLSHLRAAEAGTAGKTYVVNTAGLNVRTGPLTNGRLAPTYGSPLPKGTKWHATGKTNGDWVQGRSPFMLSMGQAPQWVNGRYLTPAR